MNPAGASARLAVYYTALFAAMGMQLPFWPLWLKSRGLDPTQIGLALAATYLVKMVVSPVAGAVVDRHGDRRRPMTVLAAGGALGWLLFWWADDFWAILAVTMISLGLWSAFMPLGDNLAMLTTYRLRLDYGRIRLWGSASFIIVATLVGQLLSTGSPDMLIWLIAGALATTALVCTQLPDTRGSIPKAENGLPIRELLFSASYLLFLGAAALNQMAHTVYYAFASIHWRAAGISDATIGLLWSEGVVAEIVLFFFAGPVTRWLGPVGLLLVAGAAGSIRWLVLGATTELPLLASAQILHAATFGCAHLGAMHFIQRAVPPGLSARAQGLYAAVALGAAPGLMSPLTGRLYDWLNGGAFGVMAGLSALCALAAWRLLVVSRRQTL